MSATDAPVDVDVLRAEIRKTYTEVSTDQQQEFIFPTGRGWARQRTRGCYQHTSGLGRIDPGAVVLDLGCGAGTDLLIAAQMTGPTGRVIGVDMTPTMLDRARQSAREMGFDNVHLHESLIESLPLEDASVDVVISNGVIDLVPDKDTVFDEIENGVYREVYGGK